MNEVESSIKTKVWLARNGEHLAEMDRRYKKIKKFFYLNYINKKNFLVKEFVKKKKKKIKIIQKKNVKLLNAKDQLMLIHIMKLFFTL